MNNCTVLREAKELCKEIEVAQRRLYVLRAERGDELADKTRADDAADFNERAEGLFASCSSCEEYYECSWWHWRQEVSELIDAFEVT
jgi:hypothetical protein